MWIMCVHGVLMVCVDVCVGGVCGWGLRMMSAYVCAVVYVWMVCVVDVCVDVY